MAQKHIIIVCGEPSGDLQAALLAGALKALEPSLSISAVGADSLRQAGAEIFYDIKGLAAMGVFEVFRKLPQFFRLKKLIVEKIKEEKPDAIVLVDFSGFNLRLAKALNRRIPTFYFISPQVWASRKGRIRTIKKYVHKMLVLFKFEEELYKTYGVDVEYVGHPLLDTVKPSTDALGFLNQYGLSQFKKTVALLPGSRKREIENILPIMLKAGLILSKRITEIQFVIAKPLSVDFATYNRLLEGNTLEIKIIEGRTYDCLHAADLALVASGTATLEAAIMQTPFAVLYKMNLANYLFYRPQVRVPCIAMANIVAQRKVVPEFVQFQAKPQSIADEALKILTDSSLRERIKKDLDYVRSCLGEPGAAKRAANAILTYLSKVGS